MKIAYIVPSLENAGPVNVVHDLVEVMIRHDHQCVVYYFNNEKAQHFSCKTQKISMMTHIDINKYDIVHTHGLRPNCYLLLHKPLRCTAYCIATFHNYVFEDYSYIYPKYVAIPGAYLTLMSIWRHHKVIVLSRDAMNYYKKWIKEDKLSFVYNTRNIDFSKRLSSHEKEEILSFKNNDLLIGINSSIHPRKGIDLLIGVLKLLPNNYKLFIVGDGSSEKKYQQLSKSLGVEDRIYWAGRRKEAYRYLPYYDIFVLPSRSEGFPLSLLEAAAYGKNIVCSDIPVFKELYANNEVSMFELPNVESLLEAIKKAADNPMYGINVKNKYERMYSPKAFYDCHLNVYKNDSKL